MQACSAGDQSLGGLLEGAIIAAYELLDAYHGPRNWDPLAHHRSAIEPHAQDEFREPLDAVIDGLREFGVKALPIWPDLPDRWWNFDRALMRRVALHLIANDPARSEDEKLAWALDRTGLYADYLKHETYQLLAATVGGATGPLRSRVLVAAADGPADPEGDPDLIRHVAYAKYNLLAWLVKIDGNWVEAKAAFDEIQAENPSFIVREHADFDTWMTAGTWGGKSPMEVEEFIQAVAQNAGRALADLMGRDYSERHFDQPDWRDVLKLVEQAIERRPDLGARLWDAVLGRSETDDRRIDLWCAITVGWGKSELGKSDSEAITRLSSLLGQKEAAHAIGRFLLDQMRRQVDANESLLLVSMRELARDLWREQGAGFTHREGSTPLSFAPLYMNSWPGFLAQYWGIEIDRRWRNSRETWTGLSDEEAGALVELLSGNIDALDATQPAIAGELFFYFAADPEFSKEHLIPLFSDPLRHAFAWFPFLHHPRWNDRLLSAGLFAGLVAEIRRLDELPERTSQTVFLAFLVSVVTYAGISSTNRRRLLDETVIASNGAHAADFARRASRFLREEGVDGAEVWRRWLGRHVQRRVSGQPRVASVTELACWADVVPFLGERIPAAVALLSGRGIGLGDRLSITEVPDAVLDAYGPELVAFYAERVRNSSGSDLKFKYQVQWMVQKVQEVVGESVAQPLIEAAVEIGFLDAHE